jgi:hypothetical protein
MSDNNQPDKQIEKEKENKDCEDIEESEEGEEIEENESEEEVIEREVIDFTKPKRKIEDYFLRPRHIPGLEPTRKIYSEDWRYPDNVSDELSDPDVNSDFKLCDEIQTFNYKKLIKVKPYQGIKRIYEESEGEDGYTD